MKGSSWRRKPIRNTSTYEYKGKSYLLAGICGITTSILILLLSSFTITLAQTDVDDSSIVGQGADSFREVSRMLDPASTNIVESSNAGEGNGLEIKPIQLPISSPSNQTGSDSFSEFSRGED